MQKYVTGPENPTDNEPTVCKKHNKKEKIVSISIRTKGHETKWKLYGHMFSKWMSSFSAKACTSNNLPIRMPEDTDVWLREEYIPINILTRNKQKQKKNILMYRLGK